MIYENLDELFGDKNCPTKFSVEIPRIGMQLDNTARSVLIDGFQ